METLLTILSSINFWKIAAPALIAIGAWFFNERSKRIQQEYERKEESYKELLRTLRGFYVSGQDTQLKSEFLHQLNLCWLYAPDEVIKKAYKFLSFVHTGVTVTDEEKELAVGALITEIRKDLISRNVISKSALKPEDFKHLVAT